MNEDRDFQTHLSSNLEPFNFLLAASKSWETDNLTPGYDSPLSVKRDIEGREGDRLAQIGCDGLG